MGGWDGRERRGRIEGEKEREVVRRGEALLIVRVCKVPDCTHVFIFTCKYMYALYVCTRSV